MTGLRRRDWVGSLRTVILTPRSFWTLLICPRVLPARKYGPYIWSNSVVADTGGSCLASEL